MNMNLRLILFIIFVFGFCCNAAAESLTDSVRIHFRVNKTAIDSLLMGNDASMRGFADRMQRLSSNDSVNVSINSIRITGAASPEGSIPYNKWLSERRAQAITRWLGTYFDIPDSITSFTFKGRDWSGLIACVNGDTNVPYRTDVLNLLSDIATPVSDTYKRDGVARLKSLHGGVPYRYLLHKHFPGLRASEVFINATVTPIPQIEPVDSYRGARLVCRTDAGPITIDSLEIYPIAEMLTHEPCVTTHGGYFFGIKNNMLHDAVLIPNLGVEFPIDRHFSVGVNWMYAWWKNHERNRHWRIYGGDVNARYYLGGGSNRTSLQGHHIGVYGQVLLFQTAFGRKGYISGIPGEDIWGKPWLGGGVEYGYSLRLAHRLNLDFSIGVGYIGGEYRVYNPIDNCYVWNSTHRQHWFGPAKAEVSLVWLVGKMPKPAGTHGSNVLEKGGVQ